MKIVDCNLSFVCDEDGVCNSGVAPSLYLRVYHYSDKHFVACSAAPAKPRDKQATKTVHTTTISYCSSKNQCNGQQASQGRHNSGEQLRRDVQKTPEQPTLSEVREREHDLEAHMHEYRGL